jgi:hypothetical protein
MTNPLMMDGRESSAPAALPEPAADPQAIRLQLQRIVEHPSFRASKRCRHFLEHVIAHALTFRPESLKERVLGAQVFGRAPSYDTAADPVVRVTAGDIRRRLGQYYAEPAHQRELRIELPAGSYTPSFYWPSALPLVASTAPAPASDSPANAATVTATAMSTADPGSHANGHGHELSSPANGFPHTAASSRSRWSWRRRVAIVAGALGALAGLSAIAVLGTLAVRGAGTGTGAIAPPVSAFDRFWAPLVQSKVPVLMCTGSIDVYDLPMVVRAAVDAEAAEAAAAASALAARANASGTWSATGTPTTAASASASPTASAMPATTGTTGTAATAATGATAPTERPSARTRGDSARPGQRRSAPPTLFDAHDIQRVGAGFISVADAVAIVRLAAIFQQHGTPYQVRENRATTFADLRNSPTVLVGMFSNAWTLRLGSGFRFVAVTETTGRIMIRDRQHPDRRDWHLQQPWPSLAIDRDYALVSRVFDPATGTMVVMSAGITPFGTAAAAEFLTSPERLNEALRDVPADWPTHNLQIVLETRVIGGSAAPAQVLATHVW